MDPFTGFDDPQAPPTQAAADARIRAQDALLGKIITPAYVEAARRIDAQEAQLMGVVSPAVKAASLLTQSQEAALLELANRCRMEARARVEAQRVKLDLLAAAVEGMPDAPVLLPPPREVPGIEIGDAVMEEDGGPPERFGLAPEEPERPVPPPGYMVVVLPGGRYGFSPIPGYTGPTVPPPPPTQPKAPGRAKPSPPVGPQTPAPGTGRPRTPPGSPPPGEAKPGPQRPLTQKERDKIRRETYKGLRTKLLDAPSLLPVKGQPRYGLQDFPQPPPPGAGFQPLPPERGGPPVPVEPGEPAPEPPGLPPEPVPEPPLPPAPPIPPPVPPFPPVPEPERRGPWGSISYSPPEEIGTSKPEASSRQIDVLAAGEDEPDDLGQGVVDEMPDKFKVNPFKGNCGFQPLQPGWCDDINKLLTDFANLGREFGRKLNRMFDRIQLVRKGLAAMALARKQMPPIPVNMWVATNPQLLGRELAITVPESLIPDPFRRDLLWALFAVRALWKMLEEASLTLTPGMGLTLSIRYSMKEYTQVLDYLIAYVCPMTIPSAGELLQLYLANRISREQLICLAATQGVPSLTIEEQAMATRTRLDGRAEVRDWMRFRQGAGVLDQRLRDLGWTERAERDRLIRSQEYMPPPGDLILFAVRDVFDPNKVGRAEMVKEYAAQVGLKEWFAAQGIGPVSIEDENHIKRTEDMGLSHWLAHYHNASSGQAFEMLHRLRPGRVERFKLPGPGGAMISPEPVTLQVVRDLLKEDDLNPVWRDRLAAISYNRLSRVDIRRGYELGVWGKPQGKRGFQQFINAPTKIVGEAEKEVSEAFQDAGYNATDATTQARIVAEQWEKKEFGTLRARTVRLACQLFSLGGADRETTIRTIERVGLSRQAAEAEMGLCESADSITNIKKGMAVVRRLYLRGQIDGKGARRQLSQIGISPERVQVVLRRWELELAAQDKQATAQQMCAWYGAGLIGLPEMYVRLLRIGYIPEDARRVIRHCQLGWAAKSQKERERRLKAAIKAREQAAKLTLRAMKEKERADAKLLARKLAKRTDAGLVKWWRMKLISEAIIRETLRVRGVDPDDINRWVKANLVPAKPKGAARG